MSAGRKRPAEPEKSHETKFVVGMYCGAAYHDWAFAGVDGCQVVRLYDVESDMCRLAKLFFDRRRCRGDVVRQLDIRAENVGELVTDVETAVAHADQAWVHVNAGLPCNDGSAANPRRDPSRLMEHVATFFLVIQRMRARFGKVTWFAENVPVGAFITTMKALFPECAHEVVDSANFSGEHRNRAYFSSPEFDLTKLQSLTGGCTVEEWFHLDPAAGPYEMRSGTSGSKATARWHGVARPAPTLTSNGLLARNVRTGEEWRVPTEAMESLRGLPALPATQVPSISARRAAAARAVSGAVSREIAFQLGALSRD